MTEHEWGQYANVEPMLIGLHRSVGGDKIRLFGCVAYHRVADRLGDHFLRLLDVTEAWAVSAVDCRRSRGPAADSVP